MSFYCRCQCRGHDDTPTIDWKKGVILGRPMRCLKMGVEQFLSPEHQHYPNVDVFQCEECLTIMVRE